MQITRKLAVLRGRTAVDVVLARRSQDRFLRRGCQIV